MTLALWGAGFLPAFLQLSAFYYITASIIHFGLPAVLPVKGIQQQQRGRWEALRDAVYSIGPLAVKAGIWVILERLHAAGMTKLYSGPLLATPGDVLYTLATVVALDYLHDAWFYWTHRLLHWKPLYVHVHYIHHRSKAPTAFTGYSFHLIEAAIVFANEIIVCFLFPIHTGVHRAYHIFTTLIHEGGHAGYEMAPFIPSIEGLVRLLLMGVKPCPALNTVSHHDWHHRFPTKHFSLYFTHWDRWMGTLHGKYDKDHFEYFR